MLECLQDQLTDCSLEARQLDRVSQREARAWHFQEKAFETLDPSDQLRPTFHSPSSPARQKQWTARDVPPELCLSLRRTLDNKPAGDASMMPPLMPSVTASRLTDLSHAPASLTVKQQRGRASRTQHSCAFVPTTSLTRLSIARTHHSSARVPSLQCHQLSSNGIRCEVELSRQFIDGQRSRPKRGHDSSACGVEPLSRQHER